MDEVKLEGTAEERAKKVGEAIRCALKANNGKLKRRIYQDLDPRACTACAVGSLALACGVKISLGRRRRSFKEGILEHEQASRWISAAEVDQLEMGFEGCTMAGLTIMDDPESFVTTRIPIAGDPFYELGRELARERTI